MVVGFYSLAVGSVDPEAAPSRVMKGLARLPAADRRSRAVLITQRRQVPRQVEQFSSQTIS
ncbi:MAG: hypothetical protein Kow0073_02600 [Immundisolibacter sp.]